MALTVIEDHPLRGDGESLSRNGLKLADDCDEYEGRTDNKQKAAYGRRSRL
jgi:hypothetical protein